MSTLQLNFFQFHNHHQPICSLTRTTRNITRIHHPVKYLSTSGRVHHSLNTIFTHNKPTIQISHMASYHGVQTSEIHHCSSLTDYFLNYIPEDAATQAQRHQQIHELKEEVRKEFFETIAHKPTLKQLEFLDDIQRLGLGYHFENEIEESLNKIYETCHGGVHDLDLHHTSLRFRLLRRHGFHVPCDIFKQFLDENGNFKLSISSDVRGMLSLYEASHLRIHGEDILDRALTFTTAQLKLFTSISATHPLTAKVAHALKQPLHKGVAHLESRHYISLYEQNPRHNKMLLNFSKLNFNLLQLLHKKELADLMRWYSGLDLITRLPFKVRSALVETYFCGLGLLDERRQYALGRTIYVKLLVVGTLIDDVYDICDIADLELLTEAIQRWDKQCVNQLPDNLKLAYSVTLDVFEEVEKHLSKEGRSHTYHYGVESFKIVWTFHLQFSKWYHEEYVPTFEDFMTTSVQTIGIKHCSVIGCLGLGPEIATEEVFEWALQFPKVMEALCTMCRIEDDIADDKLMGKVATHKPSAVTCYMKQYKMTDKVQTYQELRKMLDNPWKDINQAMLRPTAVPIPVLERILTQARCYHILLKDGDGFTFCDKTPMKENIILLFRDPIPINEVNLINKPCQVLSERVR